MWQVVQTFSGWLTCRYPSGFTWTLLVTPAAAAASTAATVMTVSTVKSVNTLQN